MNPVAPVYKNNWSKDLNGCDYSGYIGIDRRIMLKCHREIRWEVR